MKAVRIHEDGGPEVLRYEDAPDPEPADGRGADPAARRVAQPPRPLDPQGQALRAEAAHPRRGRRRRRRGARRGRRRPRGGQRVVINPGLEHEGGRITVVGEHFDGTHAELIALPASNVYPLDDSLSFEDAAAFPLVFETAYRMLVTRAGLREGEMVLVWGIGGGVATAALAIAKALGARVIVDLVERRRSSSGRAELGADAVGRPRRRATWSPP